MIMTDKIHTITAADNGNDDESSRRRLKVIKWVPSHAQFREFDLPSPPPPHLPPTYPGMNRRNTNAPIHPDLGIILLNVHRDGLLGTGTRGEGEKESENSRQAPNRKSKDAAARTTEMSRQFRSALRSN